MSQVHILVIDDFPEVLLSILTHPALI